MKFPILGVISTFALASQAYGQKRYIFKNDPHSVFDLNNFDHQSINLDNETFNIANLTSDEAYRLTQQGLTLENDAIVTTALSMDYNPYNIFPCVKAACWLQEQAPIHLDRINNPGLDTRYYYRYNGSNTLIYMFDTGINPYHRDFAPNRVLLNYSFSRYGLIQDLHGHGTATASNAAGLYSGAAKGAYIIPIKIINDQGKGLIVDILIGLEHVYKQITTIFKGNKIIINMSLETPDVSSAITDLFKKITDAGAVIIVASGNQARSSCTNGIAFPSKDNMAVLSVGALAEQDDSRAGFSNSGACTQVYVKGENIPSARNTDNSTYVKKSGTSMSSAIAAGMISTLWSQHPEDNNLAIVKRFLSLTEQKTATYDLDNNGYADPNLIAALPQNIDFKNLPLEYNYNYKVFSGNFLNWPEYLQLQQPMSLGCKYTLNFTISSVTPTLDPSFAIALSTLASNILTSGINPNRPVSWHMLTFTPNYLLAQLNGNVATQYAYPYASAILNSKYNLQVVVANSSQINLNLAINDSLMVNFTAPFNPFKFFSLRFNLPYTGVFSNLQLLENCLPPSAPTIAPINLNSKVLASSKSISFMAKNLQWCMQFKVKGNGILFLGLNNGQVNGTINAKAPKSKKYRLCWEQSNTATCLQSKNPIFNNKKSGVNVQVELYRNILTFSVGNKKVATDGSDLLSNDNQIEVLFKSQKGILTVSEFKNC